MNSSIARLDRLTPALSRIKRVAVDRIPAGNIGTPLELGVGLSHDLRAPLRVVEGFARILKEDYGSVLDRRGNDHVERILAAAQRMNDMIDVLLDLSRLGHLPMTREAVDLSAIATGIGHSLCSSEPERPATVHVEPGLVKYGDPGLLHQVLDNLIGNAWKYTRLRPHTVIEVGSQPLEDGRVAVCVRDNGAGFDMRLAQSLFAPFQRLHSASDFPGHGVGLAMVKRIVERHGGDVGALGEPDRGASFWFTVAERQVP